MSDLSGWKFRPGLEALEGRWAPAALAGAADAALVSEHQGAFTVGADAAPVLIDAPAPAVNGARDAGGVLSPPTGAEALSDQALQSFDMEGRLGWHGALATAGGAGEATPDAPGTPQAGQEVLVPIAPIDGAIRAS